MQPHGPKRIYTPQSLEFWFGQLEEDWAGNFTEEQLEQGRQIYRDGEIRELELSPSDAIIHRRVEKKEEYAVIEWKAGALNVRSSSTDETLARAIAVAGLHEIEELVADEIPALPSAAGSPAGRAGSSASSRVSKPAAKSDATAGRPLVLSFEATVDGLAFQAFWQNPDGTRAAALGHHVTANGTPASERGKLIGLATYARKAHFRFHQETHTYVLEQVKDIPDFLKNILPHWKKLFLVETDKSVATLSQGVRLVEVEAVATAAHARKTGNGASVPRGGDLEGLNLRWIFRAGEAMLSLKDVRLLSERGGGPMILPGHGIVALPPEKWESVSAWQKAAEEAEQGGAVAPYLLFSLFDDRRWKLTVAPELEAWKKRVLAEPSAPPALPDFLRQYQRRGVEWMQHLCETGCHGLLADEMGLGKTVQVATLLAVRPVAELPSLIVCPASVVPVWREEFAKFYPQVRLDVVKATHDFSTAPSPGTVWLASYAQLRKHRAHLADVEFAYAVLDEGQFIKNPDAKVTHSCFAIRARHRLVLTGTPLENRQLDLWSIFRFLLPGLLGTRAAFESILTKDHDAALQRLRVQIAPFILRRTKREVAKELPQKVEMDLPCALTEMQRTEYARICAEGLRRLGEDIGAAMRERSFGFFALLTRLRQASCDPALLPWLDAGLQESGKITLLMEKLTEILGSGHKVVIFSQFVQLLKRVRQALGQHFPDVALHELTGMTLDRLKPVQTFQSGSGAAVMLVSLKAAGTGITLHAADYVFLLDPWWNPAVEAQAVDRVHRIGQQNTVFVYRMVTAGTIEERIQALKASKKELFDRLLDGIGGEFDISEHYSSLRGLIELAAAPEPESAAHAG